MMLVVVVVAVVACLMGWCRKIVTTSAGSGNDLGLPCVWVALVGVTGQGCPGVMHGFEAG